jgi:hypothetical protein
MKRLKIMKLPKNYEPSKYEEKIYALWEKKRAFKPAPVSLIVSSSRLQTLTAIYTLGKL